MMPVRSSDEQNVDPSKTCSESLLGASHVAICVLFVLAVHVTLCWTRIQRLVLDPIRKRTDVIIRRYDHMIIRLIRARVRDRGNFVCWLGVCETRSEEKILKSGSDKSRTCSDMVARSVGDNPRRDKVGKMQILVKTWTGKTITLEVGADETIENVKARIQEKTGVSVEEQCLLWRGLQVEGYTLVEARIVKHSCIVMVGRCHGGMQRAEEVLTREVGKETVDDDKIKEETEELARLAVMFAESASRGEVKREEIVKRARSVLKVVVQIRSLEKSDDIRETMEWLRDSSKVDAGVIPEKEKPWPEQCKKAKRACEEFRENRKGDVEFSLRLAMVYVKSMIYEDGKNEIHPKNKILWEIL